VTTWQYSVLRAHVIGPQAKRAPPASPPPFDGDAAVGGTGVRPARCVHVAAGVGVDARVARAGVGRAGARRSCCRSRRTRKKEGGEKKGM